MLRKNLYSHLRTEQVNSTFYWNDIIRQNYKANVLSRLHHDFDNNTFPLIYFFNIIIFLTFINFL